MKNQVHPIQEKSDLRKIYFKNRSGASMLVFKDIPKDRAAVRVNALKSFYDDWRGTFIITR
jgi:hypothetical protein